ncbi:hypothetical protein CEXT_504481 [Caerostris extrusa]|uniref:Uncharacterized protein n=1 Tax=Caerostris extrusa TaxID=172846 RepID=A0AAV4XMS4_CAEEX|nr:hypothetical protein CEXT_504481 [Caerostris extrusa]
MCNKTPNIHSLPKGIFLINRSSSTTAVVVSSSTSSSSFYCFDLVAGVLGVLLTLGWRIFTDQIIEKVCLVNYRKHLFVNRFLLIFKRSFYRIVSLELEGSASNDLAADDSPFRSVLPLVDNTHPHPIAANE